MLSRSTYRAKRHLVRAASTVAILILPFLNILRLDIPTLRFYFLNSVLWVDEFYLLFLALLLVVLLIVFFSMVYGRVWCGWMCPQTTLIEIVNWLEKRVNRRFRVSRKSGFFTWPRLTASLIIALAVVLLSLVIGFNLVAYFVDPYRMISDLMSGSLGPITTGFIFGIALLVSIDILSWREKFCTAACPYGMMQFVVTDSRSQIVRYQSEREDECIDCKACVRDCMMGIDIRESPYQTECIHCGECIDSCSRILSRLKRPSLIGFNWGHALAGNRWFEKIGLVDGKRRVVLAVFAAFVVVLIVLIQIRQPISVSAMGDRATLYRQEDGRILNDYSLRISNRSMEHRVFGLTCFLAADPGSRFEMELDEHPLSLNSREVQIVRFSLSTSDSTSGLHSGPNRLVLIAEDTSDSDIRAETEIVFFMP